MKLLCMFSIIVWRLIEIFVNLITIAVRAGGGVLGDSWGTREAERVRLRCTVKEKLAHDANSEVAAMSLKIPLSCPVSAAPRPTPSVIPSPLVPNPHGLLAW